MHRSLTGRASIKVSYFRWPLLLVVPDGEEPESSTVLHHWLGLAYRKLDHHVIRQLRLRFPDLRNDIDVP